MKGIRINPGGGINKTHRGDEDLLERVVEPPIRMGEEGSNQPSLSGQQHRLDPVARLQLGQDLLHVALDRVRAEV
jgi:hypothetical protein